MAFINRMNFIWWPTMLLCIPFPVLAVPIATAGSQTVHGVVDQQVFLNPGYSDDLSKNNILWIFERDDKNSVTILDYAHGNSTEYPNEQFKSRLQYNASSGSLQIQNLRPEDRGNFIFRVVGQGDSKLELIVIEPIRRNISHRSGNSVFFSGILESARLSSPMVRWQKISENNKTKSVTITAWHSLSGSSEPDISENYKGRIDYHPSIASFILQDIVCGDEGVYQLIIQPDTIFQTVHLTITVAEISWKEIMIIGSSVIALLLSTATFLALRWKKPNQDYKSLIVCNILSFVFIIIALSFWINIKDHDFPAVVTLCTVSFWFLAKIAVFVPNLRSLIKRVFHLSKGVPHLLDIGVIPISIAIFGKMIQQIDRCGQTNLLWTSISLFIYFVIIICLCWAKFYDRKRTNGDEESAETKRRHNEELQDLTGCK